MQYLMEIRYGRRISKERLREAAQDRAAAQQAELLAQERGHAPR